MRARAVRGWMAVLVAALCGCDDPTPPPPPVAGYLEPDFSLVDANAHSATHDQMCSPRQHLGAISAWYFGHST